MEPESLGGSLLPVGGLEGPPSDAVSELDLWPRLSRNSRSDSMRESQGFHSGRMNTDSAEADPVWSTMFWRLGLTGQVVGEVYDLSTSLCASQTAFRPGYTMRSLSRL